MSQELIYTSAPRGLKPGSHGFCTVVSTQGISASLAQRLEALSGYRHVFLPQDANARLNPVLYSHLIFSLTGRRCHVLSRVCDAGLDHTQRTNKFAHHVALDPRELVPGGPAWLLAAPGFMQSTWDGEPKVLAAGRQPPAAPCVPAVCHAWQQIMGDAGWGGVLAESAAPGAVRPAVLVYRPGVEPLPLLAEALALLPAEVRWNVSFSTYFSKLPPGLDCQWRCVLEGSPEAAANQRLPGAVVIDLCRPQPAPDDPWSQAARTGVCPIPPASRRQPAVPGAYRASDAESAQLLGGSSGAGPSTPASASLPNPVAQPNVSAAASSETYDVAESAESPPSIDGLRLPPPAPRPFKRKPKSKWPIVTGLAASIAVVAAAVVALSVAMSRRPVENVAVATPDSGDPSDSKKKEKETADEGQAKQKKAELERLGHDIDQHRDTAHKSLKRAETQADTAKEALKRAYAACKSPPNIDAVLDAAVAAEKAADNANSAAAEASKASNAAKKAAGLLPKASEPTTDLITAAATDTQGSADKAGGFAKDAIAASEAARNVANLAEKVREVFGHSESASGSLRKATKSRDDAKSAANKWDQNIVEAAARDAAQAAQDADGEAIKAEDELKALLDGPGAPGWILDGEAIKAEDELKGLSSMASDKSHEMVDAAKNYARNARESAKEASVASTMAKGMVNRAAIAESLHKLDPKPVAFPKCNETNAVREVFIGKVSELGLDDYRLDVVGGKKVLPKGASIEMPSAPMKTDKGLKWTAYLVPIQTDQEKIPVLTFVLEGGTLSAKWTDDARRAYPRSNQARNCLWVLSSRDVDLKVAICLGEPERVLSPNSELSVKFPSANQQTENGTPSKPPEIESVMTSDNLVIEPLETQDRWPCLVTPERDMRLGQTRNISIGKKGEGKLNFTFSASVPAKNDRPTFHVVLKYGRDDTMAIQTKSDELQRKKESRQNLDPERDKKQILDLNSDIARLQHEVNELNSRLDEMRRTLASRALQYRILLRFKDGSERILYTTEPK